MSNVALSYSQLNTIPENAYEKDDEGNFVSMKDLSTLPGESKPKSCPDCRSIIHSVKRYGRLMSFQRLRFHERKHMIRIETRLRKYSSIVKDSSDEGRLKIVMENLKQIEEEIDNGPIRRVFEACGGKGVDVTLPPSGPRLQLMRLKGLCSSKLVQESCDSFYNDAMIMYEKSIKDADTDSSRNIGSLLRLDLCRLLMSWNLLDDIRSRVVPILEWVVAVNIDPTLTNEALELKEKCDSGKELKEVLQAMNVHGGYDYGGGWNSHWYECPNGHPYFIGECGQAMQVSRCIECGEQVGGGSHNLLSTNRSAGGAIADALR